MTYKLFHPFNWFLNEYSRFLKQKKTDWQLRYGWSFPLCLIFLLWSFHIWCKIRSSICYIFSLLILFHWFSQVDAKFTFASEIYAILLLLKLLPSNAAKKLLLKNVEHKLEETFFDGIRGDFQPGHFILLSVPISQSLPRLTSLYFHSFLEWPLKLHCTFRWQLSGAFEQITSPKSWILFFCKYKLTKHFSSIFKPSYLPFIFVASIECTDSSSLTGKNTYCTSFNICGSTRSG